MFELIGHDKHFSDLLSKYNNNSLHTAIIIHGPKGIGKRFFIDNFIKKILEINYSESKIEHHLNLFKNYSHPDIKIIEKELDKKTNKIKSSISIDQIRSIKKFINSTTLQENSKKFILIDSADDLNISSSNSFLKTLEEPKSNTHIFLISHKISSLIPTVRSRCLKIKFDPLFFENFKIILKNNIEKINDDEIKFLFDITHGSPGIAISLYNYDIFELIDSTLINLQINEINDNNIQLSNIISSFDNDKFINYLSILKSVLIILGKIKSTNYNNNYLSKKFKNLVQISSRIKLKNIIDRFDFIIKNENDLLTFNLDKKLFMLKFFSS